MSLYPCGGFSSATLCYEAAQEIDAADRAHAVVLFLGDFDPAGVLIDGHVEAELRRHLETPLELRRLAINPEQIAAFDLPQKPRKAGDRRRLDIEQTVEAEAIPGRGNASSRTRGGGKLLAGRRLANGAHCGTIRAGMVGAAR